MKKVAAVLLAVMVVMVALPAAAHVTVSTDNPEPGGFAVYTVRVPNESDTASTVRIEVQMPEGLSASRYQPRGDWDLAFEGDRLIIEGGEIGPGQFEDFRFQARNPEETSELSFPAVQEYDDGESVAWAGEPESDTPASVVAIGAAEDDGIDVPLVVALALGGLGTVLGLAAFFRRS